jgi:hypothetical protein
MWSREDEEWDEDHRLKFTQNGTIKILINIGYFSNSCTAP